MGNMGWAECEHRYMDTETGRCMVCKTLLDSSVAR